MFKEFRDFIAKGNVLDLAVGIIIGAAFTAIVNSFVKDVISPIIGMFGKADLDSLFVVLRDGDSAGPYPTIDAAQKLHAVTFNYGRFVNSVIDFLLVAFVVFLIVRTANKARKKEEAAPAAPPADVALLTEIRDLLAAKK
ncbi:MAG TPA: large conductance mechanosensitive channel protein MscL [Fimbriimonadaceae bacterium]|nr:large conductance mechanosensitive channel protein MscL [Fimbriimonadaceae bacterium]